MKIREALTMFKGKAHFDVATTLMKCSIKLIILKQA